MKAYLLNWLDHAVTVLSHSHGFMTWNLFLAFVPLIISIWLFRTSQTRNWWWWLGLGIFIAFLPNAPYVLTDIIHLIELIRQDYSIWVVTLVLIPQYLLFIIAGVEAYVLSLINLDYYLHKQGQQRYILATELSIHALSAVGVYLGRFKRFNSWDFVTQPDNLAKTMLNDLTAKQPLLIILVTFIVLTLIYWLLKQINLGIVSRMRQAKKIRHQGFSG